MLFVYEARESNKTQALVPIAVSFAVVYSLQIFLQGILVITVLSNELQGTFLLRDINQVIWISVFFLFLCLWFFWSGWRRQQM
jgi:uncharacterized RDD family membrane protein YckC